MTYACPYCNWSLPEPDPSDYPDTEQGQDDLAADCAYFELEKDRHACRRFLRALPAPRIEYLPLEGLFSKSNARRRPPRPPPTPPPKLARTTTPELFPKIKKQFLNTTSSFKAPVLPQVDRVTFDYLIQL